MQNMSWHQREYGYRGGWGPHPGFFILPMILMGVLFFAVLKFLWPLILLGVAFMIVRKVMIHHVYARGEWTEQQREWMRNHRFGWPGQREGGRRGGFGPHGHFGHHGQPGERGERSEWGHGRRGPWGWDSNEEQPKRKNEDEDDDKPKRDGNTLYV